jgi:biotin operon repressor
MPSEKRPSQTQRIIDLMHDGRWLTLGQIVSEIGSISEAGVSARLRDIRKLGYEVEKHRMGPHFWAYSVRQPDEQQRLFE